MSDLDAYLARIGYRGPRAATPEALADLVAAHVGAIPFSNVEILCGAEISLAPEAVFDKLVTRRRGGYCFEQNGLFARMLAALGFEVRAVAGRVTLRLPPGEIAPRDHMALIVRAGGADWLADVGFGALSPTAPLRLVPDVVQDTPHEPRRLVANGHGFVHEARLGADWVELYRFTRETFHAVDQEVSNWWTSAHPGSRFRQVLMVARALPGGGRLTLTEHSFTRRARDGTEDKAAVRRRAEVLEILRAEFGLDYPPGTRLTLPGAAWADDITG